MGIFKDYRTPLYKEAVQFCQRPFSSRMGLNGGRNVFVERIDRDHEPIQRELGEGLLRIEQVYNSSMSELLKNTGLGGAAGGGFCALLIGVLCISAGPGAFLIGAAAGGLVGGTAGSVAGAVATKGEASRIRLESLKALFQQEIDFVSARFPELNQRIQDHPEEHFQIESLKTQFNWVLHNGETLAKEVTKEILPKGAKDFLLKVLDEMVTINEAFARNREECENYNRKQAEKRAFYLALGGDICQANSKFPNRWG